MYMACMAKGKRDGLLIVGGGLTGSLTALAMARVRPEVPVLLIEEGGSFGGDHIWSFVEGEIDESHRWLIDSLVSLSWPGHYVSFPDYSRKLKIGYHSIRSQDLDQQVRQTLRADQYRLQTKAVAVRDTEVVLPGGEKIRADGVIDARGAAHLSMLELGWRKFLGREYSFPRPHRVDLPVLIDANVDQVEGCHFFSCLPLSDTRLLVEDTYFSDSPELDRDLLRGRVEAYLELRGWREGTLEREQSGVLPLVLSEDVQALWRGGSARVAKLGTRGGFLHPSTGYSLADTVRTAILLTEQKDFSGEILHDLFEAEVGQVWRRREFYRSFNRALFDAPVWERHKILAALHKLEPSIIQRFHTCQLGMIDRRRISGIKISR
jgi:lycopene beta-cyclase